MFGVKRETQSFPRARTRASVQLSLIDVFVLLNYFCDGIHCFIERFIASLIYLIYIYKGDNLVLHRSGVIL